MSYHKTKTFLVADKDTEMPNTVGRPRKTPQQNEQARLGNLKMVEALKIGTIGSSVEPSE